MNKQLKESLSLMSRMDNKSKMPLLSDIYESCGNKSSLVPLKEINAKRLIDRHSQNGYAIISASRGFAEFGLDPKNPQHQNELKRINNQRTKDLVADVQHEGFSYTLSFGGFIENQGEENEEEVYEQSVIVYAVKRNGETDMDKLFNFAIAMCNKFNQDSVLVKFPDKDPAYYNKQGEVDFELGSNVDFNDVSQTYFTDLHKNTNAKIKDGSSPTRFSFNESYIAPVPQCYSENLKRNTLGEVFMKSWKSN